MLSESPHFECVHMRGAADAECNSLEVESTSPRIRGQSSGSLIDFLIKRRTHHDIRCEYKIAALEMGLRIMPYLTL